MPSTLPMTASSGELKRTVGSRGSPSSPWWQSPLGGWHPCAEREVRKLGSALARHTGQLEGEAIAHLWGRLGILL